MFMPFGPFFPGSRRMMVFAPDDGGGSGGGGAGGAAGAGGQGGADKGAAGGAAAADANKGGAAGDKGGADKAAAAGRGDKVVQMTRKGLAEQARKAAEQGGQRALRQLATAAGFKSVEEMQAALKGLQGGGGGGQRQQAADKGKQQGDKGKGAGGGGQQQGKPQGKGDEKAARERADLERRAAEAGRAARRNEKQIRDLRAQLEAKDAEIELRETARGVGIVDSDYALHLLRGHLQGRDQAFLDAFDAEAYFKGLREKKGFLFGGDQQAADTNPGGPANKVDAADAAKKAGQNGKFNAMTAKPEEIDAYLRSLNIKPPGGLRS